MKQTAFSAAPDLPVLEALATQLRRDTVRMIRNAGHGHVGGALGLADLMAALYGYAYTFDTDKPDNPDRDRIVLSNGHTCAVWYAALARTGHIALNDLSTFRRMGSSLQGHPARKALPGLVETSTGPLGQGFSVANGIALSMKLRRSSGRVYCVLGDGELQEGQVWEAMMTAAHYKLDNLTLFISYNNIQIDGTVGEVMGVEPIADRLKSFGWSVQDINGHSMVALTSSLKQAAGVSGKPSVIIGRTLIGKGVPFMENLPAWHGTCPTPDQTTEALSAIGSAAGYEDFAIPGGAL